jgi:uncharacterized protein (DUF1330 family)
MKRFIDAALNSVGLALATAGCAQYSQPHGYMIASYDIKDPATFQRYMDAAGPLAPKYKGKVIVFNTNAPVAEGQPKSVMAIAEFPTLADAQRFYNSPEYSEAKELRIAATEGSVVITEGFVPPAQ